MNAIEFWAGLDRAGGVRAARTQSRRAEVRREGDKAKGSGFWGQVSGNEHDKTRKLSRMALAGTLAGVALSLGLALALPVGEKDKGAADRAKAVKILWAETLRSYAQAEQLIQAGRLEEADALLPKQLAVIEKEPPDGAEGSVERQLQLSMVKLYVRMGDALDRVRDTQVSEAAASERDAVRQKLARTMAKTADGIFRLVERSPGGSRDLSDAGVALFRKGQKAFQMGSSETALEILPRAEALLETAREQGADDWHVKESLFLGRLIELYLKKYEKDRGAFKDGLTELVRPYKEEDWICRAVYFFPYDAPGMVEGPGSLRLYGYDRVGEEELRNNSKDPALAAIYYRLGETASRAGLHSEAVRWFETYLDRFPQHHLAGMARQLLDLAKAKADETVGANPGDVPKAVGILGSASEVGVGEKDERPQAQVSVEKAEEAPGQWKATLPNGTTVELLGLSYYPPEDKQWWRPDGKPMTQPAATLFRSQGRWQPPEGHVGYELVYRWTPKEGATNPALTSRLIPEPVPYNTPGYDVMGLVGTRQAVPTMFVYPAGIKSFAIGFRACTDAKGERTPEDRYWVEFRNISLVPGQMTNVKVVVVPESERGLDGGARPRDPEALMKEHQGEVKDMGRRPDLQEAVKGWQAQESELIAQIAKETFEATLAATADWMGNYFRIVVPWLWNVAEPRCLYVIAYSRRFAKLLEDIPDQPTEEQVGAMVRRLDRDIAHWQELVAGGQRLTGQPLDLTSHEVPAEDLIKPLTLRINATILLIGQRPAVASLPSVVKSAEALSPHTNWSAVAYACDRIMSSAAEGLSEGQKALLARYAVWRQSADAQRFVEYKRMDLPSFRSPARPGDRATSFGPLGAQADKSYGTVQIELPPQYDVWQLREPRDGELYDDSSGQNAVAKEIVRYAAEFQAAGE